MAVAIIMIDGSKKPKRQLGFELQSSHVIENRNNNTALKKGKGKYLYFKLQYDK